MKIILTLFVSLTCTLIMLSQPTVSRLTDLTFEPDTTISYASEIIDQELRNDINFNGSNHFEVLFHDIKPIIYNGNLIHALHSSIFSKGSFTDGCYIERVDELGSQVWSLQIYSQTKLEFLTLADMQVFDDKLYLLYHTDSKDYSFYQEETMYRGIKREVYNIESGELINERYFKFTTDSYFQYSIRSEIRTRFIDSVNIESTNFDYVTPSITKFKYSFESLQLDSIVTDTISSLLIDNFDSRLSYSYPTNGAWLDDYSFMLFPVDDMQSRLSYLLQVYDDELELIHEKLIESQNLDTIQNSGFIVYKSNPDYVRIFVETKNGDQQNSSQLMLTDPLAELIDIENFGGDDKSTYLAKSKNSDQIIRMDTYQTATNNLIIEAESTETQAENVIELLPNQETYILGVIDYIISDNNDLYLQLFYSPISNNSYRQYKLLKIDSSHIEKLFQP